MPVAAVDIGTNSIRLLISDQGDDVLRRSVVTGLGRGIAHTGRLSPDGVARGLDTLRTYRSLIDDAGATAVRAVMTASGRDAADAGEFIEKASSILGIAPETITGDEEARLAFQGATADLPGRDWTVVDIGGGSTEIVTYAGGVSHGIGSVRVTDLYLEGRPVSAQTMSEAEAWIRSGLSAPTFDPEGVIGVAGTWTTLASMTSADSKPAAGIHHFVLTTEALGSWCRRLAELPIPATAELPGLDPARAPVILGGALIAMVVLGVLGVSECLVSEHDLLDGIVAQLS